MPLFSRKDTDTVATDSQHAEVTDKHLGKSAPTPKRSQQVQQNVRPLIPADRKEAKREARQRQALEREKARVGFERGDERYLPVRDRGPVRRYVRDYVDARISLASFMMPAMILVILLTLVPNRSVASYATIVLWGYVIVAVVDCLIMGWLINRRVTAKFGQGNTKGNTWYAAMRAIQMRFLRMPKPQVKLFQFPK